MKREIAATIFSMLLAGTALAQTIESSELPPPAQSFAPDWSTDSSAELWLHGIPEYDSISLDALAAKQKRYPSYRAVPEKDRRLPTAYNWQNGKWRAKFGTQITTASPSRSVIPSYLNPGATEPWGGTGALNGRLEYDANAWQFYGGTRPEIVANPDGTLATNTNFLGGTYYKLPSSVLDGRIGTGFEVNPEGDAKTRFEYRQKLGSDIEGFLAAERSMPFQQASPDASGVRGLKAGINRKF